jgi:hypothetical protein
MFTSQMELAESVDDLLSHLPYALKRHLNKTLKIFFRIDKTMKKANSRRRKERNKQKHVSQN